MMEFKGDKVDCNQAEEYIRRFIDYERFPGIPYASRGYELTHVEELLRCLSDPHLAGKTVHVAGTKGKGSTAAMIGQTLSTSGHRTGLYTSPHLHNLRERIRVDGNLISPSEFAALVTELKPYFEAINASYEQGAKQPLTFFEALTVLAFVYFRKEETDFQVLEVGLGGRLDATNVAKPEVCVITPISLDHTQILGNSLGKIAYEKAGIIKHGCWVVLSPQPGGIASIIEDICRQRGASLVQVGRDVTWRRVSGDFQKQSFVVQGRMGTHHLTIPLLGDYQVENAATAVTTLEVLASLGLAISAEDIARGLSRVEWPGRFQILSHKPIVLVDSAHNNASMMRLVENIKAYFNYDKIFVIIGVSCDKDIPGIVKELKFLSPQVIVTRSSHPRAASPLALAAEFAKWGINPRVTEAVAQALSQTLSMVEERDLICVTGSLFVVAEALDYAAEFQISKPKSLGGGAKGFLRQHIG